MLSLKLSKQKVSLVFVVFFSLIISINVFASSCDPTVNEYYFVCVDGQCIDSVKIAQVQSHNHCSRRIEVGLAPPWMFDFIEQGIKLKGDDFQNGTIRMTDYHNHLYLNERLDEFLKIKAHRYGYYLLIDQFSDEIDMSRLVSLIDKTESDWLTVYSSDITGASLKELRLEFEPIEKLGKLKAYAYWIIFWAAGLCYLVFTVWSTCYFHRKLYCKNKDVLMTMKLNVLPLQLVALLVSFLLMCFQVFDVLGLTLMFTPILILIMFIEVLEISLVKQKN